MIAAIEKIRASHKRGVTFSFKISEAPTALNRPKEADKTVYMERSTFTKIQMDTRLVILSPIVLIVVRI